jgi:hypothetical protein
MGGVAGMGVMTGLACQCFFDQSIGGYPQVIVGAEVCFAIRQPQAAKSKMVFSFLQLFIEEVFVQRFPISGKPT